MFLGKNVRMFPVNSARMSQELFQDKNALMSQDRCPSRSADRSQDSSARMFPARSVEMFQDRSQDRNVATYPGNSARMCQDSSAEMSHLKSVPMFQDNSVERFLSRCVTLLSQPMENKRNASVKISPIHSVPMLKIETQASLLVNTSNIYQDKIIFILALNINLRHYNTRK